VCVRKNGAERADCREADRGAVHSSVSAARLHRPVGAPWRHSVESKLTVWTHSQGVFAFARRHCARCFGVAPANVICIHMEGAGCSATTAPTTPASMPRCSLVRSRAGRSGAVDARRRVQMWEPFGSAMRMKMRADLSADGTSSIGGTSCGAIRMRGGLADGTRESARGVVLGETLAADLFRPTSRCRTADRTEMRSHSMISESKDPQALHADRTVADLALRTLGAYASVFAIESLMETKPLRQRAPNPWNFDCDTCATSRARAVIETAARNSGWQAAPWATAAASPATRSGGAASGFAKYKNHACYCAWSPRSKSTAAAGSCVSHGPARGGWGPGRSTPDGIVNQIRGRPDQSASWTLKEALKVDRRASRPRAGSTTRYCASAKCRRSKLQ